MASASASYTLALKQSAMGKALMGHTSLVSPQGYQATTPIFIDTENAIAQSNGILNPALGSQVIFNIDKTSTLVCNCVLETVMSAGQTAPAWSPDAPLVGAPLASYVSNVGDLIAQQTILHYGTSPLQTFPGRFVALNRILCKNDVDIEGINAMVLGNTPPGGAREQVLIDAWYRGVTLYSPLDELFFQSALDQAWMPEAYALEGQIRVRLAPLDELMVTTTRTDAQIATRPVVTSCLLRYTSIVTSAAEKDNRLKLYRTPEGLVQRCWTIEEQLQMNITGSGTRVALTPLSAQPALRSGRLSLGNYRADLGEIIVVCHRVRNPNAFADFPQENGVLQPYSGSYVESDAAIGSLLVPNAVIGSGYSTMIELDSIQLYSGQKPIYDGEINGFWNRAFVRKFYHPNAQLRGAVYTLSFARYPEDRKNATGHISAAVAGQLGFEIVVKNPGAGPANATPIVYHVSAYAHVYNFMQSRGGGIAAAYQ